MKESVTNKNICDILTFNKLGYDALAKKLKEIKEEITELNASIKELKQIETALKDAALHKLSSENCKSVKTTHGILSILEKSSVVTEDYEKLFDWLEKRPEMLKEILLKKPYKQEKIKALLENEDDQLPPGLGWYREKTLSIKRGLKK